MALASWEPELDGDRRGAKRVRCLVDLDAPCNMACVGCRRPILGRRLLQEPALGLVEQLAADVVAAGAREASVVFYGGEPLLAPDQLLAQARALREGLRNASVGCALGLVTNGTRLDRGTALRLARAGFTRVCVTLAGTGDRHEVRRRVQGGGPNYRLILENLNAARQVLEVVVRYELREDMDLLRLPEFVAELRQRGLLGGERSVKVVAQPPRPYARLARELFAPPRLRALQGGKVRRGDAEPR